MHVAGVHESVVVSAVMGRRIVVWGTVFWQLRKRGGPVLFVERQVAHVWAGSVVATIGVFVVEVLLKLPVLTLSPILAVIAGLTFVVKAGMLSGSFYVSAAALFLTAIPMASSGIRAADVRLGVGGMLLRAGMEVSPTAVAGLKGRRLEALMRPINGRLG